MGGREIETLGLGPINLPTDVQRAAALYVAGRVAADNPHPLDDRMPALAGGAIAKNPAVRRELRNLLDALGLPATPRRTP